MPHDWIKLENMGSNDFNGIYQVLPSPQPGKTNFSIEYRGSHLPSRSLTGSVRTWFSGSIDYSSVNTILQVADDDNNVNRQAPPQNIEYSMSSKSSIFAIDNATGLIRVLEPALNFEKKWTYIVDVTVSDDGMVFNWNTQAGSISTMKSEELSSVGRSRNSISRCK